VYATPGHVEKMQATNLMKVWDGRRRNRKKWIIAVIIILIVGIGVIVVFFNPKKMVPENKSLFKPDPDTLFNKIMLADFILLDKTQVLNIRRKAGDVNTFMLPLKIPVSKTMNTIKSLQRQDSTYLDIDTNIVYNTIFGSKKIPVTKKVKINVPLPPRSG
jgi:hypothetical protein